MRIHARLFVISFFLLNLVASKELLAETGLEDGFVLIAPLGDASAYLLNSEKQIVHRWDCGNGPANVTYLLPNGNLLRTAKIENELFQARGGSGGGIKILSWDSEVLWDYTVSNESLHAHHDVEPLPNGNVLVIAWERHTRDEAIANGRDPDTLSADALWPETILELKPKGKSDAEVVWQWRLWDHVVQESDETKANFGSVAENPRKVDLNYGIRRGGSDWIHMNAVDYNAELDQIALSARWFDEVWIIDHSTTTEEAAGSKGGRWGKGGDILYRWGNPEAYFAGFPSDRQFFAQHDVRWIDRGLPGAGNFLVFNNGDRATNRTYSSVDEFKPPIHADGSYVLSETSPFDPETYVWTYKDESEFSSERISGAQRLANGNTLICSGSQSWVFVVNTDGERIWELQLSDLENERGPLRGGLFRAPFYSSDFPAFDGKKLQP